MDIRPYVPADREGCLAVCSSASFAAFLEYPEGPFFVMEHDGAVAGCGGFTISGDTARLHWGMIREDQRSQGLGRFLLMYRLREIGKAGDVQRVLAEVPSLYASFFEKQGFKLARVTQDTVEMVKKLAVCA